MSVIQGSGLNGNWGLVRQVGPWRPTKRDRVGAGYTQGNVDVIRPYVVKGNKPPPKLSHWAQRSIVSKKAYDNGFRKSVPGMRYNAVSASLLGISNTMLGIGARGSGGGVSQGNQTVDVNGRQGNAPGVEDPVFELPPPVNINEELAAARNDLNFEDSTDSGSGVSGPGSDVPTSATSSSSASSSGGPGFLEGIGEAVGGAVGAVGGAIGNMFNPIVMNDTNLPGEFPEEEGSPPQYENNYGIFNPYPDTRENLPPYQQWAQQVPEMTEVVGRRPIVWAENQRGRPNYDFRDRLNAPLSSSSDEVGPSRGQPLRIDVALRRNPRRGAQRSPIVESDQSSGRDRSGGSSYSG